MHRSAFSPDGEWLAVSAASGKPSFSAGTVREPVVLAGEYPSAGATMPSMSASRDARISS